MNNRLILSDFFLANGISIEILPLYFNTSIDNINNAVQSINDGLKLPHVMFVLGGNGR